jgi:DHHC palmitoyltransferase
MGGGGGGAYGYGNPAAMNPMMDPYDDHWKKQQQSTAAVSSPPSSPLHCLPCCGNNSSTTDNDPRYYRDDFNDYAWTCNFGTTDEDGIWLNQSDPAGTIMAMMVWILLGYSCFTITCVAQTGGIPPYQAFIYTILVAMALACHVKTSLTDPGSVPAAAVPTEAQRKYDRLSMCSQCQTFKPPLSHHCRICNRCISRMDRKFWIVERAAKGSSLSILT